MYAERITIYGNPKALKRHRTYTRGKGGKPLPFARTVDPNVETKADFLTQCLMHKPSVPLTGPVSVSCLAVFGRPKGHFRTGKFSNQLNPRTAKHWHTSKPDRDNVDKLILDSLTGIFWRDDSQVCAGGVSKMYGDRPRIEIEIKELQLKGPLK